MLNVKPYWFWCIVLTAATAAEAPVKPSYHASLPVAIDAASTDNSLIMLVFSADWCAPCKLLKKETLASPEFTDKAGPLRIVEINIDIDQKTTRSFGVSSIPTLLLVTAESKIASRRTGYLNPADLLKWLDDGRQRVSRGEWEGTATGGEAATFVNKLNAAEIGTNEMSRLIHLLGDPDPSERSLAGKLLLKEREHAVPPLIEALADPYLGVRIAAGELLQKLAADAPVPDPWDAESSHAVEKVKEWWARAGKLPPPDAQPTLTPAVKASIKTALDWLVSKDPVRRTEGMSTLVSHGAVALPDLRTAIKQSESKGDHRTVALLEDVRWAILVPDRLESRAAGVRQALARGSSQDRQAAAERLAPHGRDAIPALAELINDSDPLVIEKAVRALSRIGGKDSVPAVAALLTANDSNLRMTAAQALGKTSNTDAAKLLLPVMSDPDEIVACTAIAAVEEAYAKESSPSRNSIPTEVTTALEKTLADPRWRVRATAAEVAGKLRINALAGPLRKLLDDKDEFVVTKTLAALTALSARPDTQQLTLIASRLPALRGEAVEMLVESGTDEAPKVVLAMFDANPPERVSVLHALARAQTRGAPSTNDPWKPLMQKAIAATNVSVRRAAAEVLASRPIETAAELVEPLLSDSDLATQAAGADVVFCVMAGKRRIPTRGSVTGSSFASDDPDYTRSTSKPKTNKVYASAEQLANWHNTLLKHSRPDSDPRVHLAAYATGDGRIGLDNAIAALKLVDAPALKRVMPVLVSVLVSKLPWPEGKPLLEALSVSPALFAAAAHESHTAAPDVANWLLDPARFVTAVEKGAGDELNGILHSLLDSDEYGEDRGKWNLVTSDRAVPILQSLVKSTNAGCRAAALYALGRRDAAANTNAFEQALTDSNPWVRAAAIQGIARAVDDQHVLEKRLASFLFDTNKHLARVAALALLADEIQRATSLDGSLNYFTFENAHVTSVRVSFSSEDRPLAVLEHKPDFLPQLKGRLASADAEQLPTLALLLAQYGEFDGIDPLAAKVLADGGDNGRDTHAYAQKEALLTAIGLSRDEKYLPVIRRFMDAGVETYELQKVLKALRGMSGPEVRQLRLDINKRMRQGTTIAD